MVMDGVCSGSIGGWWGGNKRGDNGLELSLGEGLFMYVFWTAFGLLW